VPARRKFLKRDQTEAAHIVAGVRLYALPSPPQPAADAAERRRRLDALVDVFVAVYAPLPGPTLAWIFNRLRLAVPQWEAALPAARQRLRRRLVHARVDGLDWFWPEAALAPAAAPDDAVRLLAPFDPIVWDRRRFSALWGWTYRFEAYTPPARRRFGYYALPVLWRDRVVGWATVAGRGPSLAVAFGYPDGRPPRDRGFARARDQEVHRLRTFLDGGPGEADGG